MCLPLVACSHKLAIKPARGVVSERASFLARSRSVALDFLLAVRYTLRRRFYRATIVSPHVLPAVSGPNGWGRSEAGSQLPALIIRMNVTDHREPASCTR
jgi:hypothetical protein